MTTSFARVRTEHAKDYLAFLVRISKRYGLSEADDEEHAFIHLNNGACELKIGDGFLDIAITAGSISEAATLEDIVSDRLDNAASDEELHYQWVITPQRSHLERAADALASSPMRFPALAT